jgi:hypothetical protein
MEPSRSRALRLALATPVALLVFAAMPMPEAEAGTFDFCTFPWVGVIFMGAPACVAPCLGPTYGIQTSGSTDVCVGVPPIPPYGFCTYGAYVGTVRVCQSIPYYGICNPPNSVGAYVGSTGTCQSVPSAGLCSSPYTGVRVGTTSVCYVVAVCGTGSYGAYVGNTGACVPQPVVGTCSPPSTVGGSVNGVGTCQPVPSVGTCAYPSYGVRVGTTSVCQSIPAYGLCGAGSYGAYVGTTGTCVPHPSVSTCNPDYGHFGAKVNGAGACVDAYGPVNSILYGTGVTGDYTGSDPWVRACANYVCNRVATDPSEGTACLNAVCAGSADLMDLATDTDNDGYSTLDELLGNSDPTNAASRPWTDDDCDGKPNSSEADLLSAQGIGHPVLSMSHVEVEADPETLAVEFHPPHFSMHQEGSSSC